MSTRPWVRWAAVAIPGIMVVGMLAVTPVALASKVEAQYDAIPQCGAYEGMGRAAEE